ncbi:hypothetical protein [Corynebacterium nuruki]|jgi:hypothetical protein|uniref:Secreted protein n=1 Tax=Corynebacterium nuruki TaxID=1032851 RepID=A0A3D4SZP3_9CORY|nr:hypothetical protein [Corynebacterium nuruki]HCT14756.1 hypothetical protein [Corynebacterium nuruki]
MSVRRLTTVAATGLLTVGTAFAAVPAAGAEAPDVPDRPSASPIEFSNDSYDAAGELPPPLDSIAQGSVFAGVLGSTVGFLSLCFLTDIVPSLPGNCPT